MQHHLGQQGCSKALSKKRFHFHYQTLCTTPLSKFPDTPQVHLPPCRQGSGTQMQPPHLQGDLSLTLGTTTVSFCHLFNHSDAHVTFLTGFPRPPPHGSQRCLKLTLTNCRLSGKHSNKYPKRTLRIFLMTMRALKMCQ